jgi:ankyrin repeat protein
VLDLGEPFISPRGIYKDYLGRECSPLTTLARSCGFAWQENIDLVGKAILLLERGADILCRNDIGDTVLHTILKCGRLYETLLKPNLALQKRGKLSRWRACLLARKDLLMVFITAGAEVDAANGEGQTPTMVASDYGREEEWIQALTACGFDANKVLE